ncbi:MAG: hypothetical protein RIQ59_1383 [Bacteroidota bacterium]|jgi:hypothetical protein
MKKSDLVIGFIIGIVAAGIAAFLFLLSITKLQYIKFLIHEPGIMGKVITLGAIINILIFFFLLKKDKELMARGIVLATIILALITVLFK